MFMNKFCSYVFDVNVLILLRDKKLNFNCKIKLEYGIICDVDRVIYF